MPCESIFPTMVGIFRAYVSPIIFVLGIFGNNFVIWNFTSKPLRNRYATYNIFLASSHIIILIIGTFLDDFLGRGLSYAEVMYTTSSWILVAFSLERIFTLYKPFDYYAYIDSKNSIIICSIVVLTSFAINIPVAVSSSVIKVTKGNTTYEKCDLLSGINNTAGKVGIYFKVIISFVIPTFLVLIINGLIILKMWRISKSMNNKIIKRLSICINRSTWEMNRIVGYLGLSSFSLILIFPLVVTMIFRLLWSSRKPTNAKEKRYEAMLSDLSRFFASLKDITYAANFYIYCLCLKNFKWIFLKNLMNLLLYLFPRSQLCKTWKMQVHGHLGKTEIKKTTKKSSSLLSPSTR